MVTEEGGEKLRAEVWHRGVSEARCKASASRKIEQQHEGEGSTVGGEKEGHEKKQKEQKEEAMADEQGAHHVEDAHHA